MSTPKKNLIFLSSPNGIVRLKKLINAFNEKADTEFIIVAGNHKASRALHEENLTYKIITEYSPPDEVVMSKGMKWFKSWQNAEIEDHKNIKEFFTYNCVSIWWFIEYWLYDTMFFFDPALSEIIRYIETALHLVDVEKPSRVIIIGDETRITCIMYLVSNGKQVPVEKSNGCLSSILSRNVSLHMKPSIKLLLMFGRLIVRKLFWDILNVVYRPKQKSLESFQNHMVLFSADRWNRIRDHLTLKFSIGDMYMHPIISELKRNPKNMLTFVGLVRGYDIGLRTMREQITNGDVEYKPFESFLSMKIIVKVLRKLWKARPNWKRLINSKAFKNSLFYEGVPLYYQLKPRFSFFFQIFPLIVMLNIEMAMNLVEKEKPDIIVMSEDTVMDGRAIIIAAKLAHIPSLCIQHGIRGYPGEADSEHDISDIGQRGEVYAPYCPIPDKMAVYGEIYKRKCIEVSKYSEEVLEITGSPRYDILAYANRIYDKKEIFDRLSRQSGYRLDPRKKTVLLLTQHLISLEEMNLILKYTYRALKKLRDVQIIVKPHPGEFSTMHREVADEEKVKGVVIVENFDTYELLYVCDLAISAFSTVQLEAIALDKPTISINVFKRPYWSLLDGDEAIVSVSDEESLFYTIRALLFSPETLKEIKENMETFKRSHLYKVDGLASERVGKLIYSLIERSRKTRQVQDKVIKGN